MASHPYRDRIRIRVNGLLVKDQAVLLAHIHSPVIDEPVWTPPGGGLEFGESMKHCLKREFLEETGLEIEIGDLRFINELMAPPFQAVEFYFDVTQAGGNLHPGSDPEHRVHEQLLKDVRWVGFDQIEQIRLVPVELKSILSGRTDGMSISVVCSSFHKGSE